MTTTATHSSQCFDLAVAMVQEELELQGVSYDVNADETDLDIPAWGTTVYKLAAQWIDEGTATCRCHD